MCTFFFLIIAILIFKYAETTMEKIRLEEGVAYAEIGHSYYNMQNYLEGLKFLLQANGIFVECNAKQHECIFYFVLLS